MTKLKISNDFLSMPLYTDNLCRRLCIETNLDQAGLRKYILIRFLRIMIFINCIILIELANIGFYFDTNMNWKLAFASKILAVVSGGFQSIALPFLILLRKYLERRYFERKMTERNVVIWRIPVRLPEIVNGRNLKNNDLFDHIWLLIVQIFWIKISISVCFSSIFSRIVPEFYRIFAFQ